MLMHPAFSLLLFVYYSSRLIHCEGACFVCDRAHTAYACRCGRVADNIAMNRGVAAFLPFAFRVAYVFFLCFTWSRKSDLGVGFGRDNLVYRAVNGGVRRFAVRAGVCLLYRWCVPASGFRRNSMIAR